MKNIIIVSCAILGLLIVAGFFAVTNFFKDVKDVDEMSKAYVDEVVPLVLTNLSQENLFLYADEKLKKLGSPEQFDKFFNSLSNLGAYKVYNGSEGEAHISVSPKFGKVISGNYICNAEFENGPAVIKIVIIKREDGWKILNFNISSDALICEN
jgi:hypothetical protein